ncbi:unnamed protein product [Effrenium voratum]|uniref:Uncharacterized protein n=1 Tax=Effrenium voratum TaxID=2562239 RepID=A0AA36IMU6_9DINO|nr:unnamed protein product [Effrenium voratum]
MAFFSSRPSPPAPGAWGAQPQSYGRPSPGSPLGGSIAPPAPPAAPGAPGSPELGAPAPSWSGLTSRFFGGSSLQPINEQAQSTWQPTGWQGQDVPPPPPGGGPWSDSWQGSVSRRSGTALVGLSNSINQMGSQINQMGSQFNQMGAMSSQWMGRQRPRPAGFGYPQVEDPGGAGASRVPWLVKQQDQPLPSLHVKEEGPAGPAQEAKQRRSQLIEALRRRHKSALAAHEAKPTVRPVERRSLQMLVTEESGRGCGRCSSR